MKLGTDIKNGNDGIYINDNNFWYTNGHFRTGFDASNFIHQSGSKLEIKTATFDLDATTVIIDSAGDSGNGLIRLGGSGGPNTPTSNTAGIYMDGGGAFNVVGDADNLIRLDGGNMTLKSEAFGETLVPAYKKFIKAGNVTPPLAKETIKARRARKHNPSIGGTKPLYDTGKLAESIRYDKGTKSIKAVD